VARSKNFPRSLRPSRRRWKSRGGDARDLSQRPAGAQGTQQVSSNVIDVQRGAIETGSASSQVLAAAKSLAGDSTRLKVEVQRFLESVRAA